MLPYVEVYLPQMDGILLEDAVLGGAEPASVGEKIFRADTEAIFGSAAILIVLNGRTVDEGAAFELGVAWASGKKCAAFKADSRQLLQSGDNPMITGAVSATFTNFDQVAMWAAILLSGDS